MVKILGISGSLRKGSYNTSILRAAKDLLPDDVEMDIHDLRYLPLYNDDLAADGPPDTVKALRRAIASADGLLIACPEYNYSMTGVLKNALDWAGTFTLSNLLEQKPTAIMGASRTVFGTARAQLQLRQVLHASNANIIPKPEVYIRRAQDLITEDGMVEDQRTLDKIGWLLNALIMELASSK